jgi:phage terminase large subunit
VVQVQQQIIRSTNGSEFIFRHSRNNVTKLKSLEGIDVCWVDGRKGFKQQLEALIPRHPRRKAPRLDQLQPLRRERHRPISAFVVNPPATARVANLSWRDNPWFPGHAAR